MKNDNNCKVVGKVNRDFSIITHTDWYDWDSYDKYIADWEAYIRYNEIQIEISK